MRKEWWLITNCEGDIEAGYPEINLIVEGNFDDTTALESVVNSIEKQYGIPDYRLDITECWIDKDGIETSDFYGTAEEYLM